MFFFVYTTTLQANTNIFFKYSFWITQELNCIINSIHCISTLNPTETYNIAHIPLTNRTMCIPSYTKRIIKQNTLYSPNIRSAKNAKCEKPTKKYSSALNPPVYSNPCGLHRSIVQTRTQSKSDFVSCEIRVIFAKWVI